MEWHSYSRAFNVTHFLYKKNHFMQHYQHQLIDLDIEKRT